jgi:hypothetical protein
MIHKTMLEMSSGLRPDLIKSDFPTLLCNETNRKLAKNNEVSGTYKYGSKTHARNCHVVPLGSWSRAKLTPPLQRLHCPSKRMMGRSFFLKPGKLLAANPSGYPLGHRRRYRQYHCLSLRIVVVTEA